MSVTVARDGAVAWVAIDRPEAGNRLDGATVDALHGRLRELADGGPTVVVLRGTGPDFCLGREPAGGGPPTPGALDAEFGRIQRLNELIQHFPVVIIAALQGRAYGAGLSLAGRCDIVLAADDARLSFPEVRHGIPPTIVLSHYRYVLSRTVLRDLILTGREISGVEGVAAGLVTRAVPAEQLDVAVGDLAREIAAMDGRTLRTVKRFLADTEGMDPRDAPSYGVSLYANEMVDRAAERQQERT